MVTTMLDGEGVERRGWKRERGEDEEMLKERRGNGGAEKTGGEGGIGRGV